MKPFDYTDKIYDEMRALAGRFMQRERDNHTLQPTELVHEVFLRLSRSKELVINDRNHFLALASTQMRRILVEYARDGRVKRGLDYKRVTLANVLADNAAEPLDILAIDRALAKLSLRNLRQGQVVEMRLFAGMTVSEVAATLKISERTVKSDWRVARVWLARELGIERDVQ
jgi:RNA polymerase sigma-70 factor (ECF subfamily)